MSYRLCFHNNRPCTCDDAAMQPCVAALIADYIDAIRFAVVTGEEQALEMYSCRQSLQGIHQTFPTWLELKRHLEGPS
jgi:hypothetical protein